MTKILPKPKKKDQNNPKTYEMTKIPLESKNDQNIPRNPKNYQNTQKKKKKKTEIPPKRKRSKIPPKPNK